MLLRDEWINKHIKNKINSYLKTNKNEHMATQNLLDRKKAVLRAKSIPFKSYLRKQEKSKINNLTLQIKEREK